MPRPEAPIERYVDYPWRTGSRNGRTLYVQLGMEPTDHDPCIGMADSVPIAQRIVADHNKALEVEAAGPPGAVAAYNAVSRTAPHG